MFLFLARVVAVLAPFFLFLARVQSGGRIWVPLGFHASGHHLTVEIGRSAFEADDTWQASGDRTLESCVWSN